MRNYSKFALAAFAAIAIALPASAQQWPAKPITFIVPYPPGGVTDIAARLMAKPMSEKLGQQVNVENRAGASGSIGLGFVARAQPDGYTILYGSSGALAINPTTMKDLPYDAMKSFTPIQAVWESPLVLVINPGKEFKTLEQFIAYAKANPGKIKLGSAGIGSNGHLASEQFQEALGVKISHVPYKGTAQEALDIVSGQIDGAFEYSSVVKPFVNENKMIALVTTGAGRMASFPNIPTMAELGYPKGTSSSWSGVLVPAGTPQPIVDRLSTVMLEVLAMPEIIKFYEGNGSVSLKDKTKDKFQAYIGDQITRYREVITNANIKLTE